MLKVVNKIACLLAVASVMSLVPTSSAFASDSTSLTRLETEDGKITNAVAYSGGKYLYEGYVGEDESGTYVHTGSSNKKLSDEQIEDKVGTKYVTLDDKKDNVVDLSSGTISDTDEEDLDDNAEDALYKALKKDDNVDISSKSDISSFSRLSSPSFANGTYTFKVDGKEGVSQENGNYVFLNKVANVTIYDDTTKKLVKIEKFDDAENGYTATCTDYKIVAHNSSNYYILANVKITNATTGAVTTKQVLQVVSTSGKEDDDVTVPSSVVSYDFADTLYDVSDSDSSDLTKSGAKFSAVSNGLLCYNTTSSSVKVSTVTLNKKNVKLKGTDTNVSANYITVEDSDSLSIEGSKAVSIDVNGAVWGLNDGKISKYDNGKFVDKYKCDSSFDNLDVYNDNCLVAWKDNDSFAVLSSGSSSSSSSSSSNSTSGSTSNSSGSYTGTGGKTGIPDFSTQTGWVQYSGKWSYYGADGKLFKSMWYQSRNNGLWYYLDETGVLATSKWVSSAPDAPKFYVDASGAMLTGWQKVSSDWYYMDSNGACKTGWFQDTDGSWYYFSVSTGAMVKNCYVGNYYIDKNGKYVG